MMIYESCLRSLYLYLEELMSEVVNDPDPSHPIAKWIFWSLVGELINHSPMGKNDRQKCFSAVVHTFFHPPHPTTIYRSLMNDGQHSEYYARYTEIQREYRFSDKEEELGAYWQWLIADVKPYRINRAVRWLDIFLSKDILDAIYLKMDRYGRTQSNEFYIESLLQCSDMLKAKVAELTEIQELPL